MADLPFDAAPGVHRPRNVDWKRAAALLYGDWGTSKAYVIGLAFVAAGLASFPIILAVCVLTAVVAYNYAAAHHHIRHCASGLLVPFGSRAEFIEAAVALGDGDQYLPGLRRAARAQATSLDWQHVVQRFAMLLEDRDRYATTDERISSPGIEATLA